MGVKGIGWELPKIMTVRDLKAFLVEVECCGEEWMDSQVWLSSDEEGNYYRPLYEGMVGIDTSVGDEEWCEYPAGSLVIG